MACNQGKGKDNCRPFTMQVDENKFDKKLTLNADYYNNSISIKLIGRLKDRYAQRLANQANNYPIRVGIDFAKNLECFF
jgi:hypothetical protein